MFFETSYKVDDPFSRRNHRPRLDCQPKSDFWHIQIESRLISGSLDSSKPHEIQFLWIRFKPHCEVAWNAIQIRFVKMRFQFERFACWNQILECLLRHFTDIVYLNGVIWWTRRGARRPQILTNAMRRITKSARHLSSSSVPRKTYSHQSLLCRWRKPSTAQWSPPWLQLRTS